MLAARSARSISYHRHTLAVAVAILSGAAWLAMWLGGSAHESIHHHHQAGAASSTLPLLPSMLFFVGSWTVMTVAMMLPSALPVLTTYHAIAGDRDDRGGLVSFVVAGYLVCWAAFGVVVHLGQWSLQALVLANPRLEQHAWMTSSIILMLAGLYQFTPLKARCLEKCRSPFSFVIEHWQGRDEAWQAFRLGVHHGLFCVGCCWALMLLMFVVGTTNLGWMLMLAVVMAIEKNVRWGGRLGVPLGVGLLVWSIVTIAGAQ